MKKRPIERSEPSLQIDLNDADEPPRRPPHRDRGGPGGGGLLPWVLLVLGVIAVGTFAILVEIPLRHELEAAHAALSDAHGTVNTLQGQLATLQAERDSLVEIRQRLDQEVQAKEQDLQALQKAQEQLAEKLAAEVKQGDVAIRRDQSDLVVDVAEQILFDSGEITMHARGKTVLRQVAESLKSMPETIEVRGHTDTVPIAPSLRPRFASNWELSTQRATNVVRFLQDVCEIPGEHLIAAGFSQYRPAYDNATEAGRRHNRRIELVLTHHGAPARGSQPAKVPATGPQRR